LRRYIAATIARIITGIMSFVIAIPIILGRRRRR
tara:strand:- start:150 stop:251 length:102 start_codon:yes stop_codon:yes gene_type:complete